MRIQVFLGATPGVDTRTNGSADPGVGLDANPGGRDAVRRWSRRSARLLLLGGLAVAAWLCGAAHPGGDTARAAQTGGTAGNAGSVANGPAAEQAWRVLDAVQPHATQAAEPVRRLVTAPVMKDLSAVPSSSVKVGRVLAVRPVGPAFEAASRLLRTRALNEGVVGASLGRLTHDLVVGQVVSGPVSNLALPMRLLPRPLTPAAAANGSATPLQGHDVRRFGPGMSSPLGDNAKIGKVAAIRSEAGEHRPGHLWSPTGRRVQRGGPVEYPPLLPGGFPGHGSDHGLATLSGSAAGGAVLSTTSVTPGPLPKVSAVVPTKPDALVPQGSVGERSFSPD